MKRISLIGTVIGASLVLSACGGSDPDAGTESPDSAGSVAINVAETAGIPSAFLTYGVQEGFFEEEGLDVTVDTSAGGAAAVPGLVSGGIQLAGSNTVSALLAASKGLPISMVAPGTFASETEGEDFSAVIVTEDSDIQEPADLAGKTIAVNTLENIGDVTISAALEEQGVDPEGIKFVEIGFPDMLPALERGQIDAAWEIEPFVSIGATSGTRPVLWPYVDAYPGLMVGSFLATNEYREQNPEVIESFRKGLAATAEAVSADPDAFRAALPELAKMTPEVAEAMTLPVWKTEVDVDSLTFIEEQMRAQGVIAEPFDVSTIVAE
jgi:NitT/TauT family transport system substrate-binding protein